MSTPEMRVAFKDAGELLRQLPVPVCMSLGGTSDHRAAVYMLLGEIQSGHTDVVIRLNNKPRFCSTK